MHDRRHLACVTRVVAGFAHMLCVEAAAAAAAVEVEAGQAWGGWQMLQVV